MTYDAYPWIDQPIEEAEVRLAGIRDIAAMKINAITNRGTRKDLVDLAFLLDRFELDEIFAWYAEKYPEANIALALRSLTYFVDAETTPMPRMLLPFDWEKAKDKIRSAVRTMIEEKSRLNRYRNGTEMR